MKILKTLGLIGLGFFLLWFSQIQRVRADTSDSHQLTEVLKAAQLRLNSDGKLQTESESSYREDLSPVLKALEQKKTSQSHRWGSFLFGGRFYQGNGTVIVQRSENLAGVNYTRHGVTEFGWFGKSLPDGRPAFCIQPGVPLNIGGNVGYTDVVASSAQERKAALAVYYGYYKQPSLVNKFYTESLVQEIIRGFSTWINYDLNRQVSNGGYQAFKRAVMQKVDLFYKKPSFADKTYTVKLGQSLTLNDRTGAFANYNLLSNNANVSVIKRGNSVQIIPKKESKSKGNLLFKYNIDRNFQRPALIYQSPYLQNVFIGGYADPTVFNITLNIQKEAPVTIKYRDRYTHQWLKSWTETKSIGDRVTYRPTNPLTLNGKTYVPVSNQGQTLVVKEKGNEVIFDYDLQRTVTIAHVDQRTHEKIIPDVIEKRRRGETYDYEARKDLKRGGFAYRPLAPETLKGKIGNENLHLTFYYQAPLAQIDLKRLEIYTAKAQKGLPVKLELQKNLVYPLSLSDYAQRQVKIVIEESQSQKVVKSLEWSLKALPEKIETLIPAEGLKKNSHQSYTVKIEGLEANEVLSQAEEISTEGYTASEADLEANGGKTETLDYRGVIMTGRNYGEKMEKKYEQFWVNVPQLSPQKTGYGFAYRLTPTYTSDLGQLTPLQFQLVANQALLDSYLPYPKNKSVVTLPLEKTKTQATRDKEEETFELPEVDVERETGALFTPEQVRQQDPHLHHAVRPGGRKWYVPIWLKLGDYEVEGQTCQPIGVNAIQVKLKTTLAVKAYMFGAYGSKTIAIDEIVFSPVNSQAPFGAGLPQNMTPKDKAWFQSGGKEKP